MQQDLAGGQRATFAAHLWTVRWYTADLSSALSAQSHTRRAAEGGCCMLPDLAVGVCLGRPGGNSEPSACFDSPVTRTQRCTAVAVDVQRHAISYYPTQ